MRNRKQSVRPAEPIVSPIIDIAMMANKVRRFDLQPLEELSKRTSCALKSIGQLEIIRFRTAVAMRSEKSELMEDRRLLIQLRNDPPVSTGTQTYYIEKKPCRVRYVIMNMRVVD